MNQLESHFRGLTDESVDVANFNGLKQAEKETALEFELRLKQLARRVNESNEAMIRTRYIEGLRDKTIRERAFVDGISLQDVVKMATRKEAIATKTQSEFSPWSEDGRVTFPVAAVAKQERKFNSYRGGSGYGQGFGRPGRGRSDERRPASYSNNQREEWSEGSKRSACKRCGAMEHRRGFCQAEKAPCFKCGKIGHFGRMCKNEVNSIDDHVGKKDEVEEIFS